MEFNLKRYCLFAFLFWYFIVSVKKYNWFLYVNLVSCYFAKFISSSSFCVKPLGFLSIVSCHLHIRTILPFPCNLDTFYLFIFLFWLLWLGLPINTVLNRRGESGHPCLAPDFSGKAFNFSPLYSFYFSAVFYLFHI